MITSSHHRWIPAVLLACSIAPPVFAQTAGTAAPAAAPRAGAAAPSGGVTTPPDYVIGPDDVLTIVFWREKDLSSEAAVRPDGMISLPLLNEIAAAGLTPEQLRLKLTEQAAQYIEEPTVTVQVKQINSRKVFITGQIAKPGPYPLAGPTTVLQLIATAGGVLEYADSKKISIMRVVNGRQTSLPFNYGDVERGKNLEQNILLKPGDTILVP